MKSKSSKRIENKKKKIAAFIEISTLNEHDRQLNRSKAKQSESFQNNELEPDAKKSKTESETPEIPASPESEQLGPSGKPKLSGLQLQELKKLLRDKTKQNRQSSYFRLREVGVNASLRTDLESRVPLFLSDIQHLIMYSQLGHHSPYSPARWCALERFNRLANTCVVVLEGYSLSDYVVHEADFVFLNSTFENKLEVLSPNSYNSDVVEELSMVPLTGTQMRKYIDEFGTLQQAVVKSTEVFDMIKNSFPVQSAEGHSKETKNLPPTDCFPRTQLILSGWQMVEENYPLPIKGLMEHKYRNYVLTKEKYDHVTPFSKMFGIDCEMCKTTSGELELTRVSVVNEKCNIIYDTLVKPENKITDYLTRFSGITYKLLKNIKTKLKDVQEDLQRLLPSDAILVGQSLANDLHALKMMHPYIIDTSVIFNLTGDRSRKTKLKTLTEAFLSEKIQEGKIGHCSTEDSIAALKLTQLKLSKNLSFGDAVIGNVHSDLEKYADLGTYNYATSMLRQCTKIDKTAVVVSVDDINAKYKQFIQKNGDQEMKFNNIKLISKASQKDAFATLAQCAHQSSLSIAHIILRETQLADGQISKQMDNLIERVYEKLPNSTLCIILFSGATKSNGSCFINLKKDLC